MDPKKEENDENQAHPKWNYEPLWQSPYILLGFEDDPDPVIDARLRRLYERKTRSSDPELFADYWQNMDYRITPIKRMSITCSEDIFNKHKGESLNELFVVSGYYEDVVNRIITKDKRLIGKNTRGMTVEEYMSYRPMAPSGIYFRFKDGLKLEESKEVQFTVELETEEGTIISSTTSPITLLP